MVLSHANPTCCYFRWNWFILDVSVLAAGMFVSGKGEKIRCGRWGSGLAAAGGVVGHEVWEFGAIGKRWN